MIIAVTGTPGTGKTSVSKALAKLLGYEYVSLNDFAKRRGLIDGYDRKRRAKEIDTKKLSKVKFPINSVIDGHLSHYARADVYVVLRTRPDVLKKRLQKKGWSDAKIRENVEAELIGLIASEARGRVMEVDTTRSRPNLLARKVAALLTKGRRKPARLDWLKGRADRFLKFLR